MNEAFFGHEMSANGSSEIDARLQVQQEFGGNLQGISRLIAIASTFTADPVRQPFKFWIDALGIPGHVEMAPYAQIMQELLNPESLLSGNKSGFNILLIRLEDWIRDRLSEGVERNIAHIRTVTSDFLGAMTAIRARTSAAAFVFIAPASYSLPAEYTQPLEEIEHDLVARLRTLAHVHCRTHADLIRLYPVVEYGDPRSDRIAHIPYTSDYFAAIATLLVRQMAVFVKPQCKVIAIDCDNTLWQGICGEDGPTGVGLTPAHLELQAMLVRQYEAGVLLCLCSKNNPNDVEAVFKNRTEMPLREEHLISSRVNWNSKSSNLQSLAQELDLSLDSFIFIDDSALECAEVRANCPAVLALQFPETQEEIRHFLHHVWAFDRSTTTEEAKRRTAQYKENRAREVALKEVGDLEEFLASLELKVEISAMQSEQLPRVAELIQRTNQFNLTTIRRSMSDIEVLWNSGDIRILVVHVRDRFGDYGLVGSLLFRNESAAIDVDTFVLSCRALGRGVEHRIVNELGRIARAEKLPSIVLKYRHTPRNAPAWTFLEKSFRQFRSDSKCDVESGSEIVFTVPAEHAETLGNVSTAKGIVEKGATQAVPASLVLPRSSSQWHETVYRLSRLSDILQEINGFVQRGQHVQTDYVAPRTPTEVAIADIVTEILGLEQVSIRADFFELGGDSLQAVQVVARIDSVLGLELPLHEFLEGPTIEAASKRLAGASRSGLPIQRIDRTAPIPLSWAQQRLWFIDQLEGGSSAYDIFFAIRLRGELNVSALREALNAIVRRHEVLRTVFVKANGEPIQQIAAHGRFSMQLVNVSAQGTDGLEAELLRQLREELAVPFDLSAGPLIRGRLVRLVEDDHVLLITMNHMVSDGWSIGVLFREVGTLYTAYVERQSDPLPPLPIQYADYAQWQRQWLTEAQLHEQLMYWKRQLQGVPDLLELPTDRPRPAVKSYRGDSLRVSLGADLTADLKSLSRRLNLTLAMTLYAGWSILLSRLSGQEDIVVGMPVANRRRTELEELIGFFVNTLAIRVRLEDDPPVTDLLRRVKEIMLGAYAHQDAPFEQVVETVQPARSLSRSPIFQVMFALQNAPRGVLQLPGLTLTEHDVSLQASQYDLYLSLRESADEVVGFINYASDLFDGATIERWIGCFKTVLAAMARDSNIRVSQLPFTSEDERRRILTSFNATQVLYPKERLIHELFEEQVDRAPEAVAVVYGNRRLTYAELNRRANQLAHALVVRGVRPDDRVGLCVERSTDLVVGLLGILKAGGAYVPLDAGYPAERLRYMLRDSAPAVLVTQERLKNILPTNDMAVIALDAAMDEIDTAPDSNLYPAQLGLRSCHLASVIYTSGSTGMPKGVMVEHAGLCNLAYMQRQAFDVQPHSRVLQFASLSFDACTWEWVMALCSGACLCLASREDLAPGEPLLRTLQLQRITHATLPPVALGALPSGHDLQLNTLIVAGEACPPTLARQWAVDRRFINAYGPTEATVCASMQQCDPRDNESLPIGRPIPNAQIYILDRHGQLVPIGVVGEIHIGGAGVTRGYLGRPELTAQRFMTDPFGVDDQGRLYKTGDLGKWRADGTIEFIGRNDHQVKIRGFRIELGEIEIQLARHERVSEAVVVARQDTPGDKRLVAYITQTDEVAPKVEELRAHLKALLPDYMIPSAFVVMENLPLTPNGKLDRSALPTPEIGAYISQQYEAPEGEVEETLKRIWQELLPVARIGRRDNFFDLGGHSLLTLKALFKINQSFGCTLRVIDVYKNPTIRELAECVSGSTAGDEFVDLSREATLDDHIVAMPGPLGVPPRNVLLTGATGFVGRFLLAQLLEDTDANIYCLVRAKSEDHALSRLRATLSKWDLWRDELERRVVAIPGDLRQARLGIDEATYQMLCREIDSIFHCATSMNHLETYAMAKPVNVESAKELLKLATRHKPKLVNYVSTLSIFGASPAHTARVVNESSPIDDENHRWSQGYVASKWVGEKIFMTAAKRGIPCNIFRLGFIWADTQRGRYDELQHGYRVLKSCLISGCGIRNYRYEMAPTPVDYAARAMVFLADQHPEGRGIFHISSSSQRIDGVFERCNEITDASLYLMSHYEWVQEMKRLHDAGQSLPAVPLIESAFSMDEASFYEHERSVRSENVTFDCRRTHRALESAGIVAPVLDDDLLRECVESMCARDAELQELIEVENHLALMKKQDGLGSMV